MFIKDPDYNTPIKVTDLPKFLEFTRNQINYANRINNQNIKIYWENILSQLLVLVKDK